MYLKYPPEHDGPTGKKIQTTATVPLTFYCCHHIDSQRNVASLYLVTVNQEFAVVTLVIFGVLNYDADNFIFHSIRPSNWQTFTGRSIRLQKSAMQHMSLREFRAMEGKLSNLSWRASQLSYWRCTLLNSGWVWVNIYVRGHRGHSISTALCQIWSWTNTSSASTGWSLGLSLNPIHFQFYQVCAEKSLPNWGKTLFELLVK